MGWMCRTAPVRLNPAADGKKNEILSILRWASQGIPGQGLLVNHLPEESAASRGLAVLGLAAEQPSAVLCETWLEAGLEALTIPESTCLIGSHQHSVARSCISAA